MHLQEHQFSLSMSKGWISKAVFLEVFRAKSQNNDELKFYEVT